MMHTDDELTDRQFFEHAVAALTEIERRGERNLPKDQVRNQPVSKIIATLLEFGRKFPS
jgi:hypothetical protein